MKELGDEIASDLYLSLCNEYGLAMCFDEDKFGGKIDLEKALVQSCILVTVLNENSVERELGTKEWEFAIQHQIPIIPIYNSSEYNKAKLTEIVSQINALGTQYQVVTQWRIIEYTLAYKRQAIKELADSMKTLIHSQCNK